MCENVMKFDTLPDVDGLVERLRGTHTCDGCGEYVGSIIHDLCDEAATSLEAQAAELARLRSINAALMGDDEDQPRYTTKRLKHEIATALSSERAAHAETKRERDEARTVHRWSVDDVGNGTLYVCRNEHDKGDACEWEPFVPLHRAEAAIAQRDEALKALLCDFEDFINQPPQYEDHRMVRDYRHELYRKWEPLCRLILSGLEQTKTRLAEVEKALSEIECRPEKMIWGEDSEVREAMNDMAEIARRALGGKKDG